MGKPLVIIDYGMGNLRSVANAFAVLGCEPCITNRPEELREADRIVLPGVGAFGDGIANLHDGGWVDVLEEEVRERGKPFLGLCIGMQLLATTGTEHGTHRGLGWIPGSVEKIQGGDPPVRIPHIGWNDVYFAEQDGLYAGMGESKDFYFVHSYAFLPDDPAVISGRCRYGIEFAASVERDNIAATQYHPEKSQRAGLTVLANFLKMRS